MFTVTSKDPWYNSALMGNGEIVTVVGPMGYHNGLCNDEEQVNRTIFWAGRRLKDARTAKIRIPRVPVEELIGPTIPLLRMGRILRSLEIDGKPAEDDDWQQTMDFDHGQVISQVHHKDLQEITESQVCLNYNLLVFHTRFINTGERAKQLVFTLEYQFGDAEGLLPEKTRLHIRRPHPDDLEFGNVEGIRSLESDLDHRQPHELETLSVQYEVEGHIGEVHWGRSPVGIIKQTSQGGVFVHQIMLQPAEHIDLWFWATVSDRNKYTHFLPFSGVQKQWSLHRQGWADFWRTSKVQLADESLNAIRKASLYTMRCNSSPWTCPAGYLSTHWEGRTFHDEFYPFMAWISSNYPDLAIKIPNYRLLTLPAAVLRACGNGANFGWEVTETGEESAPYGHWVDEQFRHGQISEQAWRYYLHSEDLADLQRYYPVLKGCAEWMIYDVLRRNEQGKLRTRIVADISEHVTSAENSLFAATAAIKCLRNAEHAAKLLQVDRLKRQNWQALALELEKNLPADRRRNVFRYADDTDLPLEPAHLGMVYPFTMDMDGERVHKTMKGIWKNYLEKKDQATSKQVFSYNWIWAAGRLATICFYLGLADEGYKVLQEVVHTVGPFMTPNEHYRAEQGPFLPWFVSGAGAYVYAMNAMFVQVIDERGAILLPAVPEKLSQAAFAHLLATKGVTVSGKIAKGRVQSLTLHAPQACQWSCRMPRSVASGLQFSKKVKSVRENNKWTKLVCRLKAGDNPIIE